MEFTKPWNLTLFLEGGIYFANLDIFSASDFYSDHLKFVDTSPLNDAFNYYGIGNLIMLVNSGSYFVMQLLIILKIIGFYLLNKLATLMPKNHYVRIIGIYFEIP